ncbi:MAG TPA: hypothetical protein VI385_04635 [Flavisolibacter sp.]
MPIFKVSLLGEAFCYQVAKNNRRKWHYANAQMCPWGTEFSLWKEHSV